MFGKAFNKAKELGSKTKKTVSEKLKEQKRKIAVDVINDTDNKVKTKQEHIHLDRARQIVVNKFNDGGGVKGFEYHEDKIIMNDDIKDSILDDEELQKFITPKSFVKNKMGKTVLWVDWMDYKQFDKLANFLGIKYDNGGGVGSENNDINTLNKELVLYHYTDDEKPIISTKKDRLIPKSLSASTSTGWSYWGKNKFKIILPKNTKILTVDKKTFWNYGKEIDTPIARGKEIYKKAIKEKADVIFLNKIAGQPPEYCILNNNFKYEKIFKDGGVSTWNYEIGGL